MHQICFVADAKILHGLSKDVELEPLIIQEDNDGDEAVSEQKQRDPSVLPLVENTESYSDNLSDVSIDFPSVFNLYRSNLRISL